MHITYQPDCKGSRMKLSDFPQDGVDRAIDIGFAGTVYRVICPFCERPYSTAHAMGITRIRRHRRPL